MEGEEVGALAPLDVDDLDELAGLDLVALRGGPVDAEVQPWVGQRGRHLRPLRRARRGPPDLHPQVGLGHAAFDHGRTDGLGDDAHDVAFGAQRLRGPRGRPLAE